MLSIFCQKQSLYIVLHFDIHLKLLIIKDSLRRDYQISSYLQLSRIILILKLETIIIKNMTSFTYLLIFVFLISFSIAVDPNCKIPNSDGSCYQCNDGYNSIDGGKCAQADPNCDIIYFSDGSCYQCKSGYTRTGSSNGKCVNASKLCKTFQANGNDCASCYPGYCLNNGNCIAGNSSCKTYDSSCLCQTCWWSSPVNGVCPN